ncbi:uncharacterized protein LOC126372131 [Pectinophora gossypiella]|uniref:uncharacterized protein LOC126372131 n=1 Tax=Pectinophora gossypiella TaxID=13191 RepID=UPI00214E132F|nr:uncharacterized protein LOC126372131 [Pectinophora gossypiella]
MTNVKLKLMFFLLSALLTADIVQARPYSDNTTDIVIQYNNNNTFNIPVNPNSDILIVGTEKNIPEDPDKNQKLNKHLDAIITAEQDRDVELSLKYTKEDQNVLEVTRLGADAIEKQLNTSSPLLDELIGSETDRDGTLTDIMFRPESEAFVEPPRFEFLIAGKINESDNSNKSVSVKSDNTLDRDKNSSDLLRKVDYVELVEVLKPSKGENKSAYNLLNITANEVDNDLAPDTILSVFSGFTDMQTLFLACFGTLLPLLLVLFATLLIRCMCRRWCPGCCRKKSDESNSDSSEKQDNHHSQLKSPTDENGSSTAASEGVPANGSIFTMTLKNNHLIVETEERNDITKNGRETKMKYSPDNDGIFVVEVQQSTTYRPNNNKQPILQNSPPHDPQISTNQALIHRVPEELEKKIEEDSEKGSVKFDKEKALALSSTGLSISDLSMSSIGSHNVSYSYGSQLGYELGPFGYPIYAGYDTKDETDCIVHDNSQEPLITKTPTDPDKPVVTAAIFKQDSIIGNDLQGPSYCLEGSSDGPLLSDVQAREHSLQKLHDKKLENGVAVPIAEKIESPKKALNRADSLPVRLEQKVPQPVLEKKTSLDEIKENDCHFAVPKEALKEKVYECVKDAIVPSASPKFEKLMNDNYPGECMYDQPPMITITEDIEPGKSDSSS